MSDVFDPTSLRDDEVGVWSFDRILPHEVLALLADRALTGLLRLPRGKRADVLYLREGQPVGVELAEVVAPLGQLLLEQGDLTAASYVQAQRLIDDDRLRQVLQLQAARKAQRFVEGCRGRFEFARGLSFLTGFVAASLDMDLLVAHALRSFVDEAAAEQALANLAGAQLRAPDAGLLRVEALGYGLAEERFLARLSDWQTVDDLDRYGTLPRVEMARLLHFLQLRRRLQLRPALDVLPGLAPTAAPPAAEPPPQPAAQAPRARGKRRREKTERISIELPGWSEPREARIEKTEQLALPSVLVDYSALGVRGQPPPAAEEITAVTRRVDEPDDDDDDDASKNNCPTIQTK